MNIETRMKFLTAKLHKFKVGNQLPSERVMSGLLGISRSQLREFRYYLFGKGLITLEHGKRSTVIKSLAEDE